MDIITDKSFSLTPEEQDRLLELFSLNLHREGIKVNSGKGIVASFVLAESLKGIELPKLDDNDDYGVCKAKKQKMQLQALKLHIDILAEKGIDKISADDLWKEFNIVGDPRVIEKVVQALEELKIKKVDDVYYLKNIEGVN